MSARQLTTGTLAELLCCNRSTITRWRKDRVLPAVRVTPNRYRYHELDVLRFLRAQHVGRPLLGFEHLPQLWKSRKAADELGVSRVTFMRWARARRIPHYRITETIIRFYSRELFAWIEEKKGG